jgi:hypothetical protein
MFFYTINGKGQPLSDIDLIKSSMFNIALNNNDEITVKDIVTNSIKLIDFKTFWGTLINNTNDNIPTFIKHFLKQQTSDYKTTGKNSDFEEYLKNNSFNIKCLTEIYEKSKVYKLVEMKEFDSEKINFFLRIMEDFKITYMKTFINNNAELLNQNKKICESIVEKSFLYFFYEKISMSDHDFNVDPVEVERTFTAIDSLENLQDKNEFLTNKLLELYNNDKQNKKSFITKLSYGKQKLMCFFILMVKKH